MSYRFMRVIIFFDLPTTSESEVRSYTKFRKNLIDSGFIMMQYSIYTKIILNKSGLKSIENKISRIAPKKGLIQMLVVTEKQYSGMKNIVGDNKSEIINSDERIIIL